jgi:hypothetical protein
LANHSAILSLDGRDFGDDELQRPVQESNGFSFAQLRESFVLAAQLSPDPDLNVTGEQLLEGVRMLRHTSVQGSKRSNSAGFATPVENEQVAQIGTSPWSKSHESGLHFRHARASP